jgi:hypothetical protein
MHSIHLSTSSDHIIILVDHHIYGVIQRKVLLSILLGKKIYKKYMKKHK